ncbi:serine/threonine-protein kinase [Nemania sp. FL0031]|nr:serine/threonine-protein kinase [Nemania sp. FL0031]
MPGTTPPAAGSSQVSSNAENSASRGPAEDDQLHLARFDIGKELGKGAYGRVYLARHRPSGYICALKTMEVDEILAAGLQTSVKREIEIHSRLQHPGILGFYTWFHDEEKIYLVLEYAAGGELFAVLQRSGRLSEELTAVYIAQVARALVHLHARNVIHRDIKPENILLGSNGELKLADFGYSVYSPDNRRTTVCGTLEYFAPEMLAPGKPGYTNAVDLWALGVLTYELLVGHTPFTDSDDSTKARIRHRDMRPLPQGISLEAQDFIHSLLVLDPEQRLPLNDVLGHPWIVEHNELLQDREM